MTMLVLVLAQINHIYKNVSIISLVLHLAQISPGFVAAPDVCDCNRLYKCYLC